MSRSERVDAYLAGVQSLSGAVTGLNAKQFRSRPCAGMWSPLELLCHLADSEALFAERMKRVLAEDRPALIFADPNCFVAALAYHERDPAEELAFVDLVRRQMARILRVQPESAWSRVGVHSKEGERTLEQLLDKAISHLEHHLTFLHAKRQQSDDPRNP